MYLIGGGVHLQLNLLQVCRRLFLAIFHSWLGLVRHVRCCKACLLVLVQRLAPTDTRTDCADDNQRASSRRSFDRGVRVDLLVESDPQIRTCRASPAEQFFAENDITAKVRNV